MPAATPTAQPSGELIPRRTAAAALLGLGLLFAGVAAWRRSGVQVRQPDAPVLRQRRLLFADGPDGSIEVRDADSRQLLERVQGEQGFLRGTLRGLARERRRRGSADPAGLALLLIARTDGRLTLVDPVTAERIDLESFGPSNAAVYARWLATHPNRT